MTTTYKFNPIQGMTATAQFATGAAFPPGYTRVRVNMPTVLQACLVVMAQAEIMAAVTLGEVASVAWAEWVTGLELGKRYPEMRARAGGKNGAPVNAYVDCYMATMSTMRWMPEGILNSNEKFPDLFMASTPPVGDVRALAPQVVGALTVGAIGVAAAASAAIAWWAAKREDAKATMQVESLRAIGALDLAQKIAMANIAAGQPVDPAVAQIVKDLGKKTEENRSWGVPAAIGVAGVSLGVGGAIAVMKS